MTPTTSHRAKRGFVWLAAGAATLGLGLGAAGLASAASSTDSTGTTITTTIDSNAIATPPADGARPDPASLPNGPGETVLTGDTLTQVTAAAQAAAPGATIVRAETDSGGHTYEVHVQLADGTYETLYFTDTFQADGSDTGFGAPPAGHPGINGLPGARPVQPGATTATGN
jgi:hypothetical protein